MFFISWEMQHNEKNIAMDNWWLAASSQKCNCSCITSCAEFVAKNQITQEIQPPYSPCLAPCDFWLFPKLKSSLKGKRFQTIDEIQETTTGQLVVIGRTVWGPKVSTLKGTEALLSYVQCLWYLVSSSVNVSTSHSTRMIHSGQTSYFIFHVVCSYAIYIKLSYYNCNVFVV